MTCDFLIQLAPVVQRLDNAIHWIFIRWIAIYPVDSVIQPLNNRALVFTSGHQSVTPFLSGAPPPKKNSGAAPDTARFWWRYDSQITLVQLYSELNKYFFKKN